MSASVSVKVHVRSNLPVSLNCKHSCACIFASLHNGKTRRVDISSKLFPRGSIPSEIGHQFRALSNISDIPVSDSTPTNWHEFGTAYHARRISTNLFSLKLLIDSNEIATTTSDIEWVQWRRDISNWPYSQNIGRNLWERTLFETSRSTCASNSYGGSPILRIRERRSLAKSKREVSYQWRAPRFWWLQTLIRYG